MKKIIITTTRLLCEYSQRNRITHRCLSGLASSTCLHLSRMSPCSSRSPLALSLSLLSKKWTPNLWNIYHFWLRIVRRLMMAPWVSRLMTSSHLVNPPSSLPQSIATLIPKILNNIKSTNSKPTSLVSRLFFDRRCKSIIELRQRMFQKSNGIRSLSLKSLGYPLISTDLNRWRFQLFAEKNMFKSTVSTVYQFFQFIKWRIHILQPSHRHFLRISNSLIDKLMSFLQSNISRLWILQSLPLSLPHQRQILTNSFIVQIYINLLNILLRKLHINRILSKSDHLSQFELILLNVFDKLRKNIVQLLSYDVMVPWWPPSRNQPAFQQQLPWHSNRPSWLVSTAFPKIYRDW